MGLEIELAFSVGLGIELTFGVELAFGIEIALFGNEPTDGEKRKIIYKSLESHDSCA